MTRLRGDSPMACRATGLRVLTGTLILAGALILALAGCAGGFHSSARPEQVYFLRAKSAAPESAPTAKPALTLRVVRPAAGPGLESSHIVLLEPDRRMSFYMASRWAAPLPDLVEELAVETLRSSAAWAVVQASESGFPADYLLQIRIRSFGADYTNSAAPDVRVAFDCTIGRRSGREIIATFSAEGSSRAAANKLGDVVTAFEEATNTALAAMEKRASEAVRTDAPGTEPQKVDSPVPSISR
jgi:ABC-type uncharacterized transport system auxiliary subunit